MIEKLTKEQEEKIPFFIKKWVDMAKKPTDRAKAAKYMTLMYSKIGEKEPIIIFGESPLSTSIMAGMHKMLFNSDDKKSQLSSQLYSQLSSQLHSQLHSQLSSQLRSQLYSQLHSQLYSQLRSPLYSQLHSQLESQLKTINTHWYLSIWWLAWCGWYEYGKEIGVKFNKDKYDLFLGFVSNIGFSILYKRICFISEAPKEIWRNSQNQLHKEGGASVLYKDGYALWCLNGVNVGKEIAETPSNKLDCKLIISEKNAQVRAEIIKKIGYSRILKDLQAVKGDSWREYELYEINDIDVEPVKLIKFSCPSTGTYYALRVPPSITKAREAIKWCNHNTEDFLVET